MTRGFTYSHTVAEYADLRWLYAPRSEGELAVLRSVLQWAGIRHFVHNNYFGTMQVGPEIDLLNRKTIMVPAVQAEQARELVLDFLDVTTSNQLPLLARDRVRMVVEFLVFRWFIPGKMPSKKYFDRLPS